jgi:DNA-binding Xre family transcriptional regulator
MTRDVGYCWHLRLRMAEQGMFATTELGPLLAERGVVLSREQVYRLVVGTPERLSLRTLAALCDILGCTPADLVEPTVDTQRTSRRATGGASAAVASAPSAPPLGRPVRARIIPDAPEKR